MNKFLKKNEFFKWDKDYKDAFEDITNVIVQASVLVSHDHSKPFKYFLLLLQTLLQNLLYKRISKLKSNPYIYEQSFKRCRITVSHNGKTILCSSNITKSLQGLHWVFKCHFLHTSSSSKRNIEVVRKS